MKTIKILMSMLCLICMASYAEAIQIKLDQKVSYKEKTSDKYNGNYFKHKRKDQSRSKEFTCTVTNTTPISVLVIFVVNSGGQPVMTSEVVEVSQMKKGVVTAYGEGYSVDIDSTWEGNKTSMDGKYGNSKVEAVVFVYDTNTKKYLGCATTSGAWQQFVMKQFGENIKKEIQK